MIVYIFVHYVYTEKRDEKVLFYFIHRNDVCILSLFSKSIQFNDDYMKGLILAFVGYFFQFQGRVI